jgi:hypothetical protein
VANHTIVADGVSCGQAARSIKSYNPDRRDGPEANKRSAQIIAIAAVQAGDRAGVVLILILDGLCIGTRTQDHSPQKRNYDC